MRLLDLFCGAGGCARGYANAGFTDITGVDIHPQPRYPYRFVQADALAYLAEHGHEYDVIHASPPCQRYSCLAKRHPDREYPDLIGPTRELLIASGKPYVIENVPGAPLHHPITLCGSMFNLGVRRHRLFESSILVLAPACQHKKQGLTLGVYGHLGGARDSTGRRVKNPEKGTQARREDIPRIMGIDWMLGREAVQAIPPAYTHYLGLQLIRALEG